MRNGKSNGQNGNSGTSQVDSSSGTGARDAQSLSEDGIGRRGNGNGQIQRAIESPANLIAHSALRTPPGPDRDAYETAFIDGLVEERVAERTRELEDRLRKVVETNRRLREIATTDSLTGICNRLQLMMQLQREVQRVRRYGQTLSLLMLDLDDFKSVNDRYGHPVGDRVLRSTGRLLSDFSRESDVVGRYGGEEFLVILPQTRGLEAVRLADRLRKFLLDVAIPCGECQVRVSCSIGVAELQPGMSPAELLRVADQAMYQAKVRGKNCVRAGRLPPGAPPLAASGG